MKRFTAAETALFEQMITAMVLLPDRSRFRSVVEEAGLLERDASVSDAEVYDYFSFYDRYLLSSEVVTIDDGYASGGVAHLFNYNGEHGDRFDAQKDMALAALGALLVMPFVRTLIPAGGSKRN